MRMIFTFVNGDKMTAHTPGRLQDGYFLSDTNPCANVDQREVEDVAMRLIRRPEVERARADASVLWRSVAEYTAGPQMARFEEMMDDYTFNYALKAANGDPTRPRVLRSYVPSANWFGRDVPGSRWGGDNPDNAYRLIPIAAEGRYEVHGRRMSGGIANVTYTLVGNSATSVTLSALDDRDVKLESDGSFVISVDARSPDNLVNHIQNKPGALFLFIRDASGDWQQETPNALRVKRLDTGPGAEVSQVDMARLAAKYMVSDVYLLYWFTRLNYNMPINFMREPRGSGPVGGLRSQMGSQGTIRLSDDEAMIITSTSGGAAYRGLVLHDIWYRAIEYWKRQSSLNTAQMVPDADGRYTFVVAHTDPGVANWLDTGGLGEVFALHRWQGLPPEGSGHALPTIQSQVIKLKHLENGLPSGVQRMSAADRKRSLIARLAAYQRRFADR
jgi:hypothetical protein